MGGVQGEVGLRMGGIMERRAQGVSLNHQLEGTVDLEGLKETTREGRGSINGALLL